MISKPDKDHQNNELIISRVDNGFRMAYIAFWICLLVCGNFWFLFDYNFIALIILVALVSIYWHRLRFPANFWAVKIRKKEHMVYVNKKAFLLNELLFLSFHEAENYTIIRLEARRKNMLFPNEAWLISNCSGFDEAVEVCREIRSFIDPDLKISHMRLASGKSKDKGRGSRRIRFEHREFIQ